MVFAANGGKCDVSADKGLLSNKPTFVIFVRRYSSCFGNQSLFGIIFWLLGFQMPTLTIITFPVISKTDPEVLLKLTKVPADVTRRMHIYFLK